MDGQIGPTEPHVTDEQIEHIAKLYWQKREAQGMEGSSDDDWQWAEKQIKEKGYEAVAAAFGEHPAYTIPTAGKNVVV